MSGDKVEYIRDAADSPHDFMGSRCPGIPIGESIVTPEKFLKVTRNYSLPMSNSIQVPSTVKEALFKHMDNIRNNIVSNIEEKTIDLYLKMYPEIAIEAKMNIAGMKPEEIKSELATRMLDGIHDTGVGLIIDCGMRSSIASKLTYVRSKDKLENDNGVRFYNINAICSNWDEATKPRARAYYIDIVPMEDEVKVPIGGTNLFFELMSYDNYHRRQEVAGYSGNLTISRLDINNVGVTYIKEKDKTLVKDHTIIPHSLCKNPILDLSVKKMCDVLKKPNLFQILYNADKLKALNLDIDAKTLSHIFAEGHINDDNLLFNVKRSMDSGQVELVKWLNDPNNKYNLFVNTAFDESGKESFAHAAIKGLLTTSTLHQLLKSYVGSGMETEVDDDYYDGTEDDAGRKRKISVTLKAESEDYLRRGFVVVGKSTKKCVIPSIERFAIVTCDRLCHLKAKILNVPSIYIQGNQLSIFKGGKSLSKKQAYDNIVQNYKKDWTDAGLTEENMMKFRDQLNIIIDKEIEKADKLSDRIFKRFKNLVTRPSGRSGRSNQGKSAEKVVVYIDGVQSTWKETYINVLQRLKKRLDIVDGYFAIVKEFATTEELNTIRDIFNGRKNYTKPDTLETIVGDYLIQATDQNDTLTDVADVVTKIENETDPKFQSLKSAYIATKPRISQNKGLYLPLQVAYDACKEGTPVPLNNILPEGDPEDRPVDGMVEEEPLTSDQQYILMNTNVILKYNNIVELVRDFKEPSVTDKHIRPFKARFARAGKESYVYTIPTIVTRPIDDEQILKDWKEFENDGNNKVDEDSKVDHRLVYVLDKLGVDINSLFDVLADGILELVNPDSASEFIGKRTGVIVYDICHKFTCCSNDGMLGKFETFLLSMLESMKNRIRSIGVPFEETKKEGGFPPVVQGSPPSPVIAPPKYTFSPVTRTPKTQLPPIMTSTLSAYTTSTGLTMKPVENAFSRLSVDPLFHQQLPYEYLESEKLTVPAYVLTHPMAWDILCEFDAFVVCIQDQFPENLKQKVQQVINNGERVIQYLIENGKIEKLDTSFIMSNYFTTTQEGPAWWLSTHIPSLFAVIVNILKEVLQTKGEQYKRWKTENNIMQVSANIQEYMDKEKEGFEDNDDDIMLQDYVHQVLGMAMYLFFVQNPMEMDLSDDDRSMAVESCVLTVTHNSFMRTLMVHLVLQQEMSEFQLYGGGKKPRMTLLDYHQKYFPSYVRHYYSKS